MNDQAMKRYEKVKVLVSQSCLTLCVHIAHPALLSIAFSKQGYWSGLSCHPPGDLPNPQI